MGQSGRQAGQGPGYAADLLRISGGTVETHPDVKPDRKHFRHGPASNETHQRMPQPKDRAGHGLQADDPSRDIAAQYPARQRSAQKKWRKLDGQNRLPEIIQRVEFRDGIRQLQNAA